MTEKTGKPGRPGDWLTEEPQEARGPKGSRDTGSDKPGAGPADRPESAADRPDEKADTSVRPQGPIDPDAPPLQSGGG
ncbi:hypothetical protein [Streptomyces sp. NBC_01190]|uniref:hypothetical protein n=1 Tax=Streptomyces sp. NBC_01190 TaxID=2903767 RepID=UPI00386BDCF3|nr:hypothetical protein OG519_01890 [Streptomyces sp. NBC_01190]